MKNKLLISLILFSACSALPPAKPDPKVWDQSIEAAAGKKSVQAALRLYPEYRRLRAIFKTNFIKYAVHREKGSPDTLKQVFLLFKRDSLRLVSRLDTITSGLLVSDCRYMQADLLQNISSLEYWILKAKKKVHIIYSL